MCFFLFQCSDVLTCMMGLLCACAALEQFWPNVIRHTAMTHVCLWDIWTFEAWSPMQESSPQARLLL